MSISIKAQLFYKFIRKAMSKYKNNEKTYIEKRCPGQTFEKGGRRKINYKAPSTHTFTVDSYNNLNYELLTVNNASDIATSKKKIIYVLHGGAYHLSMNDTYNKIMEKYSNGKYDVFAIDYRTAPKDPYPAAVEDAVTGFNILLEKGYLPENIIMAGDSAGGGLALAMSIKLRESNAKLPKTFILSSPWVALDTEYTEEQKATDVLFGWGDAISLCAKAYAGNELLNNPLISPIYDSFNGFENAIIYISVAKGEMLQNAAIELTHKLRKIGATVILDEMNSGVHDVIAMPLITREYKNAWKSLHSVLHTIM